jgi:tetratricopeptide (TPR) repeat protein
MKIRILFIFLSLSFSGCTLIYSYSDNLPQRINQWVSEKKYNVALNTISHIKPTHKDYRILQKKKVLILKKMRSYENAAIEKSNQLAKKGNWIAALAILDETASNIVNTKTINKHRKKLLKKRNKIISDYENDILNNQALDLISKIEFYNKIKKVVSENENNELNITEFDDLRDETSLRLAKRSEKQYQKGQYNKAFSTIKLALKLNPDNDIVLRLKKTKRRIQKATKSKRISYVNEAKALLTKLSQGNSYAILKETKEKIIWLNKIKGNEKVYLDLIAKLEKHLAAGEKQHFEAARKLYSEGKTQEALIIWLELKKLNPEHPKLQSHIKRAEKILNKLEKLSNKPENK